MYTIPNLTNVYPEKIHEMISEGLVEDYLKLGELGKAETIRPLIYIVQYFLYQVFFSKHCQKKDSNCLFLSFSMAG